MNLAAALVAQAGRRPDLRLGTVDDQIDLADALGLAAGTRRATCSPRDCRPGQRVALVAPTSTDYVITWLACVLAGLPVALVNPTYPAELIDRMLEPLDPAAILGRRRDRACPPMRHGHVRRRPAGPAGRPRSTSSPTCTPPARPGCRSSARRPTTTSSAWPRPWSSALELTATRPGARPAAAVPHQPDGLRHHHRLARRCRCADRGQILRQRLLARSGATRRSACSSCMRRRWRSSSGRRRPGRRRGTASARCSTPTASSCTSSASRPRYRATGRRRPAACRTCTGGTRLTRSPTTPAGTGARAAPTSSGASTATAHLRPRARARCTVRRVRACQPARPGPRRRRLVRHR